MFLQLPPKVLVAGGFSVPVSFIIAAMTGWLQTVPRSYVTLHAVPCWYGFLCALFLWLLQLRLDGCRGRAQRFWLTVNVAPPYL
jgi:hypothetical protein